MKTIILSVTLLLTILFAGNETNAQPLNAFEVFIGDSMQASNTIYACPSSDSLYLFLYVSGDACEQGEVISMGIDFGDGVDSLFTALYNWGVWYSFYHHYAPGDYQLTFWGSETGGEADTATVNIHVSAGCMTISGNLYEDQNSNCVFDAGEPVVGSMGANYYNVKAFHGANEVSTDWVDANGNFMLTGLPDDIPYTVSPQNYYSQSNCFSGVCPMYAVVPAGSAAVVNFGYFSDDTSFDLVAAINGGGFRPGFNAWVIVNVYNQNCHFPISGTLKVVLDPLLTYNSANYPLAGTSGDTLLFDVPLLSGNGNHYSLIIDVFTSVSAILGDEISCMARIEPLAGDNNPLNNTTALRSDVRSSWDPNDKQVSPGGVGPEGFVEANTLLTYLIRFQNTGNAEAINISVVDTIDNNLDLNTFHLINTSHYSSYSFLAGNVVQFRFDNIWLPDSTANEPMSHGSILYSIRMKPNLTEGTEILNTAYIFFDYNPAVITNTTLNTFVTNIPIAIPILGTLKTAAFPNPTSDYVYINLPEFTRKIEVYNINGELVQQQVPQKQVAEIHVKDLPKGVYVVKLYSGKGVVTTRFVRE